MYNNRTVKRWKISILTKLILNIINEYDKTYIYSPSLYQNFFKEIFKCITDYIPIHIIPNILNEEDIDIVIEEIFNNKDFNKSDIEIETFEGRQELKIPHEKEDGGIIFLDDSNEQEKNNPRVQSMFKRSTDNCLSIFIIIQDSY